MERTEVTSKKTAWIEKNLVMIAANAENRNLECNECLHFSQFTSVQFVQLLNLHECSLVQFATLRRHLFSAEKKKE